jgi:hypothetical protein
MRKEWIRTEAECHYRRLKRLSKQHKTMISINQNRKSPSDKSPVRQKKTQNIFIDYFPKFFQIYRMNNNNDSSSNLTLNEWFLINNLSHTYDNWALANETDYIKNYSLNDTSLTDFLNDEQNVYRNLILFFKQIPQFKQINIEDQILLIKCNITHLVHIHHVLKDRFHEDPKIGFHMSKWINSDFHQQMSKNRHLLDYFVQHPIVLKLSLVTFIFIINLSRLPYEQLSIQLNNQKLLIKNQDFFITLLWKYLNVIYNEKDAIKATQLIVFQYLRYQLLMEQMETIIIKQNNTNQFHPLTKSVLRLN